MGTTTSTSSTLASNEKQNHSFENFKKERAAIQSLELNSEEKKSIRHRFSEHKANDKGLRDEYFRKLNKGKKEVEEKRMSLRNSHTLNGGDFLSDDYDNLSYTNSFVNKKLNDSNFDLEGKASIGRQGSKNNSKNNSRSNSKDRLSQISEKINLTSRRTINNGNHRRSLSHNNKDQNSYNNTRNSLFLNNELESEFDPEQIEMAANMTNNIDIGKKRSFRKNNSSNDTLEMAKGNDIFEKAPENEVKYDTVSEISNIYSSQKSRITLQNNEYELNFVKNGEDLRRSYIAKLIYKKVWQPSKKEKDHNTLIIFDWDDTLLCTSFLTPNGVFNEDLELNDKEKEKLAKLEFSSLRILTAAMQRGDTYIITNAAPGWVEYSAERFYPSVRKLLDKVKIISARGDYEAMYPGDSRMWKIQAFLNMQKTFDNNLVTNIICLGDSFIEMEAAHVLASKFSQAFIKTIKFRESPKPEELNKQLSLVADQFPVIYSTVKNLTIRVEKKVKK